MQSLLVAGFGTSISVDSRKLVVSNKIKNQRLEFYPHKIDYDSIIIDGHTGSITFEAVRWLMKHGISLTILNWNGNMIGTILPQEPKTGKLRIEQYKKYLDSGTRLKIASEIVRQKVDSSLGLLKDLSRYYPGLDIARIEKMLAASPLELTTTVNNAMGYEALAAALYWENLSKIFDILCPEFNFKNRPNKSSARNMNAADEVNALLNYGYAVLESEVRKAINTVGLDPAIGFLHEITSARTPLVYDMQELFRWLIDLSVIQLLEEKKLKKGDFIVTENFHMRLRENMAKMLVQKINLNFNRKANYKRSKNYSYQSILLDNVQHLANHILGKMQTLQFNIPKISIGRTDSLEVKERILAVTPAERKRLGINKSTLWYQRRNLQQGKKIKVYGKVLNRLGD